MLDVIIIGAGAAGLAAARLLTKAHKSCLILEARRRIGGRIHTDRQLADFPVELGAEFIHGEHASSHALVKEAALELIPVDRYGTMRWGNPEATALEDLPKNLQASLLGLRRSYRQLEHKMLSQDLSLADFLRSEGWQTQELELADVLLAQTCCASIHSLSCLDIQREMRNDKAGKLEFRIKEGYAALLAYIAKDLAIQLNEPVLRLDYGKRVKVSTSKTEHLAKSCIVTLPLKILQQEKLAFYPQLSSPKRKAIAALQMEAGSKLIYTFRQTFWDDSLSYMLHSGHAARWWTPGYGRQHATVISAFLTAERAQHSDALAEPLALELGLKELASLLGTAKTVLAANLVTAKRISWAHDPFAGGAYAHVPVGAAEARLDLAKAEAPLFFAGEACNYFSNPQTVHGAFESGEQAALESLNFLQ